MRLATRAVALLLSSIWAMISLNEVAAGKASLRLPLFILIGFYCGKRKETIPSLCWAKVDFD